MDWWSLVQGAVGAMLVVMADVDPEDAFEVPEGCLYSCRTSCGGSVVLVE